jgi:hypothetical protein
MDERYFKDKISAYLDNELSPQERTIVDEYIRTHPEAQAQLARLESLKRISRAHLSLSGDDLYWERNARKIEAAIGVSKREESVVSKKSGWQNHWGKLTAVAASAVILFFIAINRDEVEKEALPSVSPSVEVVKRTPPDTVLTDVTPPLVEKLSSIEGEVQSQERVEKSKEVNSTKDVIDNTKIPTFGALDRSKEHREMIQPRTSEESVQTGTPTMSATKATVAKEGTTPTEAVVSQQEVDGDTAVITLAHWTSIHDSLAPIIATLNTGTKPQSPLMKAFKAPLTTSLRETSADGLKPTVMSWLDANFHIAAMTSDLVQKVSAIEALKDYENHADSTISAKANEYLRKLTNR